MAEMKVVLDAPTQIFVASIIDVPGVTGGPNTFLSVFNPVGSGKVLVFIQSLVQPYSVGANSSGNSFTLHRTTAASGGTTKTPNVFNPIGAPISPVPIGPPPAAEMRVDNPTVTTNGDPFGGTAPPVSAGLGTPTSLSVAATQGGGVVAPPGTGLAYRTADGDVDQRWNASLFWFEV